MSAGGGAPPASGRATLGAAKRELAGRLRWQAAGCEMLGSPLYGELLRRAAEDLESGGPVWEVLRGHEADPRDEMVQLRLMGGVHRLVLEGRAPELADCYPSTGGHGRAEESWAAFCDCLAANRAALRASLERPVQTNEPGRARALVGGFLALAGETGLPLRLLELGASAGLNLRWDRYSYRSGSWEFGDPRSPVRFEDVFDGRAPPLAKSVAVAARAGCDPVPIDPASDDGRLTLRSYVWPDQRERLHVLEAALEVAAQLPVRVDRAGAASWLADRLATPAEGATTVVFHSIVMQYLDAAEREQIDELMSEAGARATRTAPLARLAMEPAGAVTEVRLSVWPGRERGQAKADERLLAQAGYHGTPVRWLR